MENKKVGRPRKDEVENESPSDETKHSSYTSLALGIHRDSKTTEWVVSELHYDPNTLEIDPTVKIYPTGGLRDMAIEKFKLRVVDSGLFGDV